jgi:tetratricopeptide (TPR) repeat protein
MALSYWGWKGDQISIAAYTKPNPRDKNVMPEELADFVNTETDLKAIVRVAGDLELLKGFLAAGFPVIVEKGFEPESQLGWMGHYEVITAYSDGKQGFTAQDSFLGPGLTVSYDGMQKQWRAFNYLYIVVYPVDREKEITTLLGPQADETADFQYAATKASDETNQLTDPRDRFFAWYNRGSSLISLKDYVGAAAAYDQAYTIYPTIPDNKKPWRMLWYQTGPYSAYYYTGRDNDVVNLSTLTINNASEPAIEESFYWRGLAELALGDQNNAITDFHTSLMWHPNFAPSLGELSALGAQP